MYQSGFLNMAVVQFNLAIRKQMGQKGFEIFKEKFTLDKFESNLCECLKKAVWN